MTQTRLVESHSGARRNILVGPQTFSRKFLEHLKKIFLFQIVHSGVFLYLCATAEPPNVAEPGVAYPLLHPLDGPEANMKQI